MNVVRYWRFWRSSLESKLLQPLLVLRSYSRVNMHLVTSKKSWWVTCSSTAECFDFIVNQSFGTPFPSHFPWCHLSIHSIVAQWMGCPSPETSLRLSSWVRSGLLLLLDSEERCRFFPLIFFWRLRQCPWDVCWNHNNNTFGCILSVCQLVHLY